MDDGKNSPTPKFVEFGGVCHGHDDQFNGEYLLEGLLPRAWVM
jgi:hypothetical protein